MRLRPALTSTAYAILGLLSFRPWSTYELAREMKRTLQNFWPRAESHLYGEPKVLVTHGLARATRQYVGKRARRVYAITPKGRLALRRWLSKPGAPPSVEFEGLVKVLFAEQGTKRQLLATLASVRDRVREMRYAEAATAREIIRTGGTLPRLPVNALVFEFLWEHWDMVLRWVQWAHEQVSQWPEKMNTRTAFSAGDRQRGVRRPGRRRVRHAR